MRKTAERAGRAFGVLGWAAIGLGFLLEMLVSGQRNSQDVLVGTLTFFFATQITRLSIAVVLHRRQRLALGSLLLGVLLWAAGSALLNAGEVPDMTHFPSPGELLFLGSYVAMAAYLILSADRNLRVPVDTWLHVLVICGGTASLAGSVLLTPIGAAHTGDALSLFLALLYPLIDIVLCVLVIGQTLLRMRPSRADSVALIAGFLLFATADAHFVTDLASGTYHFSVLSDASWGAGFALIVGAACRPRPAGARAVPRAQGSAETLAAAAVAIAVLALAPMPGVGLYLTIPAVLTLVGAGGRLVLALREARGAAEAHALSRTDDLTRLPNRRGLRADLDAAFEAARPLSLMLLDLDGFKDVNDTLGHSAGDDVLRLMAHRLRQALPSAMSIARLGGDEFAVVVHSTDLIGLTEIARELLDDLCTPLRIDGIEIQPSASIGIAPCPPDALSGSELLRRADVAMYQAKQQRLGVAIYDPIDDDFSKTKLMMAEELRKALDDQQFELWYQPQIDVPTQELCGLEALLRWRHPSQGMRSPIEFLPAARQAGLMPAISARVAELALRDICGFLAVGVNVRVAINCAPPELLSRSFLPDLYKRLTDADVPAGNLVIEVTEDSFIADPERARLLLQDIRDHGLQVAIDDYGTGFSSLAYLRDLAIDELKIDRSFIASMLTDRRTRMIVSSTVQMARALGMRTVAEGVEDAATVIDLTALGVDVLQGYYVGRPMPGGQIPSWAAEWRRHGLRSREPFGNPVAATTTPDDASRARRSLRALAPQGGTVRDPNT